MLRKLSGHMGAGGLLLPVALCALCLFFLPTLLSRLQTSLFLSSPGLIGYSVPYYYNLYSAPLGLIGGFLFVRSLDSARESGRLSRAWKLILPAYLLFAGLAVYVLAVSITTMTEDGLTVHAPLTPAGVSYSYGEVSQVQTGYLNEERLRGVLYYRVGLNDGVWTELLGANGNDWTFSNLEYMDGRIMDSGAEKIVSSASDTGRYTGADAQRIARIFANDGKQ